MKERAKRDYFRLHRRLLSGAPKGFTLIELLVVLIIIGILAGYVGPKIMGRPEEARRTKAALQIGGLETGLKMYKLEPPSAGRLPPKWREGGYLEARRVPKDPWGSDFVYLSPGLNGDFDLSSYGADGVAGGEGDNADINNWELE
jgi:general secretion pathway protein G